MLRFLIGAPGSGKSYYLVYTALKNKEKYDAIRHNISGFKKFDHIELDDFEKFALELHMTYKKHKSDIDKDVILIEKMKNLGYYNNLVILDECHLLFDNQKAHLVWFLSYHRHLYIDLLLATQDLGLIHSRYKKFSEYYIQAVRPTFRLSSKYFVYTLHSRPNYSKSSKFSEEKIPKLQDVFASYLSGDSVKTKNAARSLYIKIGALLFVVFISLLLYFLGIETDENLDVNSTQKEINEFEKPIPTKNRIEYNKPIIESRQKNQIATLDSVTCIDHQCSSSIFYNLPDIYFTMFKDEGYVKIHQSKKEDYRVVYYISYLQDITNIINHYVYRLEKHNDSSSTEENQEEISFNPLSGFLEDK